MVYEFFDIEAIAVSYAAKQQYANASDAALKRRLDLLDTAYARGIHTLPEYKVIRAAVITEHELGWPRS